MSSPVEGVGLGGASEAGAVGRVELRVPAAELGDRLVLAHQQRPLLELLVVPHHDVPFELLKN